MATGKSGSFEMTGTKGITVKVFWSEEYTVATNQSVVSIDKLQVKSSLYSNVTYYLNRTIAVAGSTVIEFSSSLGSHNADMKGLNTYVDVEAAGSYQDAPWKTGNLTHDSDGSKSVTITLDLFGATTSGGSGHGWTVSGSKTVALTTIPRASTFTISGNGKTSAGNVYVISDGANQLTVNISRKSTTFTHHVDYYMGDTLIAEYTGITTGHSPKISQSVWLPYITDRKNTTGLSDANAPSVVVTTYDASGNKVGSAVSKRFDIYVPDSTAPTVAITNLTPVTSLGAPFNTLFIQGKSKVKATFTATGKYGATIASSSMSVEGGSYDSADAYTSDYLSDYGEVTVKVTAKDSRGYPTSVSKAINVIAYSKPKILAATDEDGIICARCDVNGNLSDSGTYLKIKARRSYSKVVDADGVQNNFCLIRYRYKAEGGSFSTWKSLLAKTSLSSNTVSSDALLSGALDVTTTYIVELGVIDDVGSTASTLITVPTESVYMHRTKNAMGLGKYVEEEDLLDVGWNARFRKELRLGEEGNAVADFVTEAGLSGGWRYKKWESGTFEMYGTFDVQATESNAAGSGFYSNQIKVEIPFAIESLQVSGTCGESLCWIVNGVIPVAGENYIGFRIMRFGAISTTSTYEVRLSIRGRWK